MLHEDRVRAEVFGSVAERYDATRPRYPAELIDDLLSDAPEAVLDVGCGTGIVAALLVARGANVLGVEPDPRMAAVARAKGIEVQESAFESWDSGGRRFGLLTAGQSWHWVEPRAGADKAAEVLSPGGRLALFWNSGRLSDALTAQLDAVYARLREADLEDIATRRGAIRERGRAVLQRFAEHSAFGDPELRQYEWSHTYAMRDWVDQLSTHSDHATLPAAVRRELLDEVAAVVEAQGGQVAVEYRVYCVTALRATTS